MELDEFKQFCKEVKCKTVRDYEDRIFGRLGEAGEDH